MGLRELGPQRQCLAIQFFGFHDAAGAIMGCRLLQEGVHRAGLKNPSPHQPLISMSEIIC
jgi:hypothetical protein